MLVVVESRSGKLVGVVASWEVLINNEEWVGSTNYYIWMMVVVVVKYRRAN